MSKFRIESERYSNPIIVDSSGNTVADVCPWNCEVVLYGYPIYDGGGEPAEVEVYIDDLLEIGRLAREAVLGYHAQHKVEGLATYACNREVCSICGGNAEVKR